MLRFKTTIKIKKNIMVRQLMKVVSYALLRLVLYPKYSLSLSELPMLNEVFLTGFPVRIFCRGSGLTLNSMSQIIFKGKLYSLFIWSHSQANFVGLVSSESFFSYSILPWGSFFDPPDSFVICLTPTGGQTSGSSLIALGSHKINMHKYVHINNQSLRKKVHIRTCK